MDVNSFPVTTGDSLTSNSISVVTLNLGRAVWNWYSSACNRKTKYGAGTHFNPNSMDAVLAYLKRVNANTVVLQELNEKDELQHLADTLGYSAHFVDDPGNEHVGMLLRNEPERFYTINTLGRPIGVAEYDHITFCGFHLRAGFNGKSRKKQIDALLLELGDSPAILAGDTNFLCNKLLDRFGWPGFFSLHDKRTHDVLTARGYVAANRNCRSTGKLGMVFDGIYYNSNHPIICCEISECIADLDHRGVYVELSVIPELSINPATTSLSQ